MRNAEAVVFDFNGTLFFDYKENRDAWNEISREIRGREFTEDEYNSMMGMTDEECARRIIGDKRESELREVYEAKENIYLRLCRERHLSLEHEAQEFINHLKEDNIKVMIASSAPKMNMDWYIENLGLDVLFDRDYIIAGRTDIPSKPAPDIFRLALSTSKTMPENAICFEDAPNGLRAALATPFNKVYCISSPGFDDTIQKTLAPVINWSYTLTHYSEVIRLV